MFDDLWRKMVVLYVRAIYTPWYCKYIEPWHKELLK